MNICVDKKINGDKCIYPAKINGKYGIHAKTKEIKTKASRVCVKVSNLRKIGYDSLKDWMNDEKIFITTNDGKKIFHYSGSEFGNPYKVSNSQTLDQILDLYRIHIQNNANLPKLVGKNLGCFCNLEDRCHVDVLIDLLNKL